MRIDRVKLATELARRELRQKSLAELAGISQNTVSAISCGKTVSPQTAGKVAGALNVPLEQIVEKR